MFAATHSDVNSLKSVLLHLTKTPNYQRGRSAKVKDGTISEEKFRGPISVDRCMGYTQEDSFLQMFECVKTMN
jgi:hypothetical protein